MKQQTIITSVLIGIIAAGLGFFGGMKYQQMQPSQFSQAFRNGAGTGSGQRTGGAARNGGGQIIGTILSMDATSITVKLTDGSSKIVLVSGATTFATQAAGAITDLKVGDRVGAFGTTNPDGSVTAQTVQINPLDRRMMGQISPTPDQNSY